jgi:hypothetical protein
MYEGLVLIDPDSAISPEDLARELRRFYAGDAEAPFDIAVFGGEVTLRWPDFVFVAGFSAEPHVREESAELAEQFAARHPDRERIARCAERFELSGDSDPELLHFNDSLFVGEALRRLGRVYRFDPLTEAFLE